MNDQEKAVGKSIIYETGGNLALAFALGYIVPWLLRQMGVNEDFVSQTPMFLFFIIIFADPVGAWLGSQTRRDFCVKLGSGMILSLAMMSIFTLIDTSGPDSQLTTAPGEPPIEEGTEGSDIWWIILMPVLIIPLIFMGPVLERILKGTGPDGAKLTRDDLMISLTFPIYISTAFLLIALVSVALWVIGAPLSVGLLVLTAGVLAAVAEAWFASDDDTLPGWEEDGKWGARPDSAAAAWAGLRKAIRASMSSALFLGGLFYANIAATFLMAAPEPGSAGDPGLAFLVDLLWFLAIFLATSTAMMVYGLILAVSLVYLLCNRRGMDPLAMDAFAKQAIGRLFFAGLHYVRPDVDDESDADAR